MELVKRESSTTRVVVHDDEEEDEEEEEEEKEDCGFRSIDRLLVFVERIVYKESRFDRNRF